MTGTRDAGHGEKERRIGRRIAESLSSRCSSVALLLLPPLPLLLLPPLPLKRWERWSASPGVRCPGVRFPPARPAFEPRAPRARSGRPAPGPKRSHGASSLPAAATPVAPSCLVSSSALGNSSGRQPLNLPLLLALPASRSLPHKQPKRCPHFGLEQSQVLNEEAARARQREPRGRTEQDVRRETRSPCGPQRCSPAARRGQCPARCPRRQSCCCFLVRLQVKIGDLLDRRIKIKE